MKLPAERAASDFRLRSAPFDEDDSPRLLRGCVKCCAAGLLLWLIAVVVAFSNGPSEGELVKLAQAQVESRLATYNDPLGCRTVEGRFDRPIIERCGESYTATILLHYLNELDGQRLPTCVRYQYAWDGDFWQLKAFESDAPALAESFHEIAMLH